jgi:hypothetical protein
MEQIKNQIVEIIDRIKGLPKREKHPPGYNFAGPGTKIYKRLKGIYPVTQSKETLHGKEPYNIPVNIIDRISVTHDVGYTSYYNFDRYLADIRMLHDLAKNKDKIKNKELYELTKNFIASSASFQLVSFLNDGLVENDAQDDAFKMIKKLGVALSILYNPKRTRMGGMAKLSKDLIKQAKEYLNTEISRLEIGDEISELIKDYKENNYIIDFEKYPKIRKMLGDNLPDLVKINTFDRNYQQYMDALGYELVGEKYELVGKPESEEVIESYYDKAIDTLDKLRLEYNDESQKYKVPDLNKVINNENNIIEQYNIDMSKISSSVSPTPSASPSTMAVPSPSIMSVPSPTPPKELSIPEFNKMLSKLRTKAKNNNPKNINSVINKIQVFRDELQNKGIDKLTKDQQKEYDKAIIKLKSFINKDIGQISLAKKIELNKKFNDINEDITKIYGSVPVAKQPASEPEQFTESEPEIYSESESDLPGESIVSPIKREEEIIEVEVGAGPQSQLKSEVRKQIPKRKPKKQSAKQPAKQPFDIGKKSSRKVLNEYYEKLKDGTLDTSKIESSADWTYLMNRLKRDKSTPQNIQDEIDDINSQYETLEPDENQEQYNKDAQNVINQYITLQSGIKPAGLPVNVRQKQVRDPLRTIKDEINDVNKKIDEIKKKRPTAEQEERAELDKEERSLRIDLEKLNVELKEEAEKAEFPPIDKVTKPSERGKVAKTTDKVGELRPHFRNPTEENVREISDRVTEQDFTNWQIFDVPSDFTGQGTSKTNPLIDGNRIQYNLSHAGSVNDFLDSYLLKEGPENVENFYREHKNIQSGAVAQHMKETKRNKEEEEFLQSFNKGANGLFPVIQTKEEKGNFKNIYQTPGNFVGGTLYPFQDTANTGLYVTDFLDNLNYFIEP